jgi:hypothetical protein
MLVERYVQALKDKDPTLLVHLASTELDAEHVAQQKVDALGGDKFRPIQVEYIELSNPHWVRVVIHGDRKTASGVVPNYQEELILNEVQGRWYLRLGNSRKPLAEPRPATAIPQ